MSERDPTIIVWPATLIPNNVRVRIERPAITGAPVVSGRPQAVVSSAGSWRVSYTQVAFTGRNFLRFRALLAALSGAIQPVYVSPFDFYHAPYLRTGLTRPIARKFTDNYVFTDTYGFSESTSDCVLAAACSAGATTISVTNSTVAPLSAGDYFELVGRLHIVREIAGTKWTIWPPTRAAYALGEKLEIDDPRCLCYLDTSADGPDPDVQFGQLGFGNFEFIEARW